MGTKNVFLITNNLDGMVFAVDWRRGFLKKRTFREGYDSTVSLTSQS